MKNIVLIVDIILIIIVLILTIDVIIYLKKSDNKKNEEVSKYVNPRITVLKIITIVLMILGIFISIYNAM